MAVELKFTDKCENCTNANLVLERNSTMRGRYWYVFCKHAEVCRYWERKLQEKERKET